MEDRPFLGCGMRFPPQIEPGTGRFACSAGARNVKESVYLILMTSQGERWLDPGFGSRIMSYTFMDTSLTMLSLMAKELRTVLLDQEPRISNVEVQFLPERGDGCLYVDIRYTITAEQTQENLVFPFYLDAAGGGNSPEP